MTVSTLDRRAFLKKFRHPEKKEGMFGKSNRLMPFKAQELPPVPPPTSALVINGGLDPYVGPWGYDQAAHLLRRTTFGVKKSDLEQLIDLTMEEAVDLLLDVNTTAPPHPVGSSASVAPSS